MFNRYQKWRRPKRQRRLQVERSTSGPEIVGARLGLALCGRVKLGVGRKKGFSGGFKGWGRGWENNWFGARAEFSTDSDDVKEIGKSDLVDSSSPDLNMANREKKKRKKRRQQRKPTGIPP